MKSAVTKPTFYDFLASHRNDPDDLGALASEACSARDIPKKDELLRSYLLARFNDHAVIRAAWRAYLKTKAPAAKVELSFYEFLVANRSRDDIVGDISRMVAVDAAAPKEDELLRSYLLARLGDEADHARFAWRVFMKAKLRP